MSTSCPSSGIFLICRSQQFRVFIGGTSSSCAIWCVQLAESGVDIWVLYGSDEVLQRWFRSGLQGMNEIFTMVKRGVSACFLGVTSRRNTSLWHDQTAGLSCWHSSGYLEATAASQRCWGGELLQCIHCRNGYVRWSTAIMLRKTTRCSVLSWDCAVTRLYDQDQVSSFSRTFCSW